MDAATSISNERGKRHDALNGVALSVRNSQLDKSASVRVAELLTVTVSRTSRRNVLGAIALKRSIATSRGDDNRDEQKNQQLQRSSRDQIRNPQLPPRLHDRLKDICEALGVHFRRFPPHRPRKSHSIESVPERLLTLRANFEALPSFFVQS